MKKSYVVNWHIDAPDDLPGDIKDEMVNDIESHINQHMADGFVSGELHWDGYSGWWGTSSSDIEICNTSNVPLERGKVKVINYSRQAKEIGIIGDKGHRGYDNNIYVWLDDNGALRIRVLKAKRCYTFSHVEETHGHIEIVATP